MIYGYVRNSKNVPDRENVNQSQAAQLQKQGAKKIFIDTDGSKLLEMLDILKPHDLVLVKTLSVFSRPSKALKVIECFYEKEINLYVDGVLLEPLEIFIGKLKFEAEMEKKSLELLIEKAREHSNENSTP